MLSLTDDATTAIRRMTNTETYPDAGLRITSIAHRRFAMSIVPGPSADDVAVRSPGVNVYLDHTAAMALSRATLDAAHNARYADGFRLEHVVSTGSRAW